MSTGGDPKASRREFVEFVRANHPDVGGDPEVFRRGLEAFAAGHRLRIPTGRAVSRAVEIHRRRRGPGAVLDWLASARRRRRRPPRVQ